MKMKDQRTATQFTFDILGYQFEEAVGEPFVDDWLRVDLELIVDGHIAKISNSPCLLSGEVGEIVSWLQEVARGHVEVGESLDFTEPTLAFGVVSSSAQRVRIRVRLSHGESYEQFMLPDIGEIEVRREDLIELARGLDDDLQALPPRR